MYQKAKALWASLPHLVQAAIVVFVSASSEAVVHALSEPTMCFSKACLLHLAKSAAITGAVAAKAFYMTANRPQPPAPPQPSFTQRVQELSPPAQS